MVVSRWHGRRNGNPNRWTGPFKWLWFTRSLQAMTEGFRSYDTDAVSVVLTLEICSVLYVSSN